MGVAAYNRGSKALKAQIDRDAKKPSRTKEIIEAQSKEIQAKDARIAELEAGVEKARKAYERRRVEISALKQTVEDYRSELSKRAEFYKQLAIERGKELAETERRWRIASHLLREHFSNEEIQEMKSNLYERFPFMQSQEKV